MRKVRTLGLAIIMAIVATMSGLLGYLAGLSQHPMTHQHLVPGEIGASGPGEEETASNGSLVWTGFGYIVDKSVLEKLVSLGNMFQHYPAYMVDFMVLRTGLPVAVEEAAQLSKVGHVDSIYYSRTNVQVAGVDEPDIVKLNGSHGFILSGSILHLVRLYPIDNAGPVESVNVTEVCAEVLPKARLQLVEGDSVVVIAEVEALCRPTVLMLAENTVVVFANVYRRPFVVQPETLVLGLDPSSLKVKWYLRLPGLFFDARLTPKGLVVVSGGYGYPARLLVEDELRPILVGFASSYTVVAAVDTGSGAADKTVFIGVSPRSIYATGDGEVYLLLPGVESLHKILGENVSLAKLVEFIGKGVFKPVWRNTTIVKLVVDDGPRLTVAAYTTVSGVVDKQWQFDVSGDYARLVVVEYEAPFGTRVNLYVLKRSDLSLVSSLEEIAVNENVHAVRFMGDKLYLVTFRRIDPLFVIDLSDPTRPRILGYREGPGFDEYLHPLGENLLVGIGLENGRVRVSTYRVLVNGNVVRVDVLYLPEDKGYSWSPVLDRRWGHRAFLLDEKHGYILIPVVYKGVAGKGGIAVIKYSGNGDLKLIAPALGPAHAQRAAYIDDVIYAIKTNGDGSLIVRAYDANTLEHLETIIAP